MRKHWIDNLRRVTVLLVLLYHVVYFYNNKGVFGGIGGFGEYPAMPQYQDVLMYKTSKASLCAPDGSTFVCL